MLELQFANDRDGCMENGGQDMRHMPDDALDKVRVIQINAQAAWALTLPLWKGNERISQAARSKIKTDC